MGIEYIKSKVNNFQSCSIEEIEEILNFIADRKRQELGIQFEFDAVYDDGGKVNPEERSAEGYLQVKIGKWPLENIKADKDLGEEIDSAEERKEFIELILQTFHELRHVKQYDQIIDNPVLSEENRKITREIVINESFLGFRNRFNYEQSMAEIDAMKTSLEEAVKFFREMGSDITPDEVFAVMKEKEFQYLNYDEQDYGDSYETAIEFFTQVYGKISDIRGLPEIIQSLPEDKKAILETECKELMDAYNSETDIEKRMDLLERMSLIMNPKLKEQYPLANMQDKEIEKPEPEENEKEKMTISNLDVEQELSKFYTDDITNDYLEAYLAEKISLIYGDRLGNAGIFNVRKFLSGKLDHFEGVESYKEIIDELESLLEVSESTIDVNLQEIEEGESVIDEPSLEEHTDETPAQNNKKTFIDKVGDRLDNAISKMDNFEDRMYAGIDSMVARTEGFVKGVFDQILLRAGFNPNCITGIKQTIKSVNPRTLIAMDNILSKTKDKTLTKGGMEDGNEQDYR